MRRDCRSGSIVGMPEAFGFESCVPLFVTRAFGDAL
jgi:hypothetical protein